MGGSINSLWGLHVRALAYGSKPLEGQHRMKGRSTVSDPDLEVSKALPGPVPSRIIHASDLMELQDDETQKSGWHLVGPEKRASEMMVTTMMTMMVTMVDDTAPGVRNS